MARDEKMESRRFSYVDVLERVADGVHVDIVNRGNQQSNGKHRHKKARSSAQDAHRKRRRRRSHE